MLCLTGVYKALIAPSLSARQSARTLVLRYYP